ncbi:unnamed protein product [Prorocentrum cordatum]|uniref:Uncharacterized protein n=1 Tax=Prorocentrum cordatum TaxID=2364126 RepID=A0ABN9WKK6_9DINO|nr:unnamed protein product [Polarella glacialis]
MSICMPAREGQQADLETIGQKLAQNASWDPDSEDTNSQKFVSGSPSGPGPRARAGAAGALAPLPAGLGHDFEAADELRRQLAQLGVELFEQEVPRLWRTANGMLGVIFPGQEACTCPGLGALALQRSRGHVLESSLAAWHPQGRCPATESLLFPGLTVASPRRSGGGRAGGGGKAAPRCSAVGGRQGDTGRLMGSRPFQIRLAIQPATHRRGCSFARLHRLNPVERHLLAESQRGFRAPAPADARQSPLPAACRPCGPDIMAGLLGPALEPFITDAGDEVLTKRRGAKEDADRAPRESLDCPADLSGDGKADHPHGREHGSDSPFAVWPEKLDASEGEAEESLELEKAAHTPWREVPYKLYDEAEAIRVKSPPPSARQQAQEPGVASLLQRALTDAGAEVRTSPISRHVPGK